MGMLNKNSLTSFLIGEQNRNLENDDGNIEDAPVPLIIEPLEDEESDHEEYRIIAARERRDLEIIEAIENFRMHFRRNAQYYINPVDNMTLMRNRRPMPFRQMFPTAIQQICDFVVSTREFVRNEPLPVQRVSRLHSILRHLILIDNHVDNYMSSIFGFICGFNESVVTIRSPRLAFDDILTFSWDTIKTYSKFVWIALSAAYHFLIGK